MQINTHVFQAAAAIYEALIAHKDNKFPHDPTYAYEAVEIAKVLYNASKKDAVYTMAAARIFCGFRANSVSSHCTRDELINLALHGASQLVEGFANDTPPLPVPNRVTMNNHPPPSMPTVQAPPSQPVQAFAPPPPVPVDVPDFTQ